MNIPFSPPDITQLEIDAVSDTLRSGWITTGPKTKRFEQEISACCGTPRSVCLSSATAAMELTLRLLEIGPSDEVITSAYTYTASASVICHVGARPVLVDTAPGSYHLDPDAVSRAVTSRTKAILPVDIAGIPCDYEQFIGIAQRRKGLFRAASPQQKALGRAAVIADAAHSFGSSRGGVPSGALADFSCFSFHAVKNLTTGEGGAVTWRAREEWDDAELYRQLQLLSLHGQSRDALAKNAPGAWEYDILLPGYKYNMTDVAASIGLAQLERYPSILARRRQLIERYDRAFAGLDVELLPHFTDAYTSNGHLYPVRLTGRDEAARNRVIELLARDGVAANVHYKPLPLLTAYRKLGYDAASFPNALALYENEVTLPLFSSMTDEQQDYVIDRFCIALRG